MVPHPTVAKERVTLVDLDCRGAEHEFYNAASILAIRYARPLAHITVAARPAHLNVLQKRLSEAMPTINFLPLASEAPRDSDVWPLYRMVAALMARILVPAAEPVTDTVVFLSCSIRSFLVMKWVALFWPSVRFIIIFHGLLERLDRRDKLPARLTDRVLKAAFRWRGAANITYCVLGRGIREMLGRTVGHVSTPCIAIDSPYLFDNRAVPEAPDDAAIVFGHLGYAHAAKGFLDFVALAQALSDPRSPKSVRFRVVGGTDRSDPRINQSPDLEYVLHGWPVPRHQYEAALAEVTYAVFVYPPGSYRLRASGALFDAIAAGKPVIALRNAYFEHIFNAVGDIGYLCDSMEDLVSVCRDVAQHFPRARYQHQQQQLAKAREAFSPRSIADQWNAQFFEVGPAGGTA